MASEKIETTFKDFAEFLFNLENPEENSLQIDLNFENDQEFCHFLYKLFCYGFQKKFGENSILTNLNIDQFNTIKKYIKALGSDVTLTEKTDNNGELKLNFIPHYPVIKN